MSKLELADRIPDKYDKQVLAGIIRAICQQSNLHAEGRASGRYQAQASVPVSTAAGVSDIVWDSNCTVRNGTVGGGVGNYVRLGWVCTTADLVNPTWQELRIATG